MADRNTIGYVLFDLDETVYAKGLGLMDLIDQRINLYMTRHLGIDPEGVGALRRKYYQLYGTTGRGLHLNHELDVEDYYEFVHALPVEKVLAPDPRLDEMLDALDTKKAIFTNATAGHARRVLRALQVERHFGRIVDIKELQYIPKPDIRAYHRVLQLLQVRADDCLLVDDRRRNLMPGRELGMVTVLVGTGEAGDGADFVLQDVSELGELLDGIRSDAS